jgi:uncharacterized protein YndB with AHSA1/START domain
MPLVRETSGTLKIPRQASRSETQGERIPVTTSPASRAGKLTFDGDYANLTFERRIGHPVEVVWKALTEPEHLAGWYLTKARVETRQGGRIDFVTGPAQVHVTGKILIWDPPRVFEHEWNVEPRQGLPKGEKTIVLWELTPEGDGTLLRFSHRRLTRQAAITFAGGMHGFLDRLENELDGLPLADWGTRVNEVRPNYPIWEK